MRRFNAAGFNQTRPAYLADKACELSGKRNGAERAENRVERSGERAWQKTMERSGAERERRLQKSVGAWSGFVAADMLCSLREAACIMRDRT